MKAHFSQVQWGRVLWTSILVVIPLLILDLIMFTLAFHIWSMPDQLLIVAQVASWISYMLTILLTFGCGVLVARKVAREPQLHGLLLGLVVALIRFVLGPVFGGESVLVRILIFVLIIAAGWLGGVLGSRGGRSHSQVAS